jgi:hypothetical protein
VNASGTGGPSAPGIAQQDALFETPPAWCLDTNVVVSFLHEDDDEHYSRQVFPDAWRAFESDIATGLIIAPPQVREELETWCPTIPELHRWLAARRSMFHDLDTSALTWAKRIVNSYPGYAKDRNYLGDLCVIALAGSRSLTVITNEKRATGQPSRQRPKIPDICNDFDIPCLTVIGYLRRRVAAAETE